MNGIMEKFLPIGSIVSLNNNNRKVMITGFFKKNSVSNTFFDYSGCFYPEGIIEGQSDMLFNHDQITAVLHIGLVTQEENLYKQQLKTFINGLNLPQPSQTTINTTNNKVSQNSGIAVLDINNIDLTPSNPETISNSQISNESGNDVKKEEKQPKYKFDENGVVIGIE